MTIFYTLLLTSDVIFHSIDIASSMPPKEKDLLTNFGKISESSNRQGSTSQFLSDWPDTPRPARWRSSLRHTASGMPPKEKDFLTNFDRKSQTTNNEESSSQSTRDWPDTSRSGHWKPSPQQSGLLYECLPNREPFPGAHRRKPSCSSGSHFPEKTVDLVRNHPSACSSSPDEPLLRFRSMSPNLKQIFPFVLGFRFEELRSIRLIPYKNPSRLFELRRYAFPRDNPVRLRTINRTLKSMPSEEQIVLSTSNGDIFAIMERLSNQPIFRGIYTCSTKSGRRAKFNMYSGAFQELTFIEIAECPSGNNFPISKSYRIFLV